jgi:hypothetical protein
LIDAAIAEIALSLYHCLSQYSRHTVWAGDLRIRVRFWMNLHRF